jgi:hypothetical protein
VWNCVLKGPEPVSARYTLSPLGLWSLALRLTLLRHSSFLTREPQIPLISASQEYVRRRLGTVKIDVMQFFHPSHLPALKSPESVSCCLGDRLFHTHTKLSPWHQNPQVHHRIHNSAPPAPILSQLNPLHTPSAIQNVCLFVVDLNYT